MKHYRIFIIPTECSFDRVNNFRALLKTFEFFPSDKVTALSEANTTPFFFNIPISAVKILPHLFYTCSCSNGTTAKVFPRLANTFKTVSSCGLVLPVSILAITG